MNKLRKRILITFFTLIFITGLGAAVWSYRKAIAEDAHDTEIESVDMATRQPNFTNIDYIIENSNDATLVPDANGYDESVYHIVEISSGSLSLLNQFSVMPGAVDASGAVTDPYASFKRVVIDMHRSAAQSNMMAADKIEYLGFSTSDLNANQTNADAAITAINNADFLYLSIDPNSKYDTLSGTDLPSDVKSKILIYTRNLRKPIIIDSPTKTNEDENGALTTFKSLGKVLFENGISYNSFYWGKDPNTGNAFTPAQLFDRTTGSVFMPINGNRVYQDWVNSYDSDGTYYYRKLDGTEEITVAKVLTITPASVTSSATMTDALKPATFENIVIPDGAVNDVVIASQTDGTLIQDANGRQAYQGTFKTVKAYPLGDEASHIDFWEAYKTYSRYPDYVIFDELKYDKANPALSAENLSKYDLIILEDSLSGVQISDGTGSDPKNDYMTFVSLMYGNQHILYGNSMIPDGSSNGKIVYDADNFNEIYNSLVDSNDRRLFDFVLVSSRKEMNETYANKDATADTENPIAYIINKGAYRPVSGSSDENADKFRVLEIQPSYPVDMQLAQQIGAIDSIKVNTGEEGMYGAVDIANYNYFFDLEAIRNGMKGENIGPDEISIHGQSLSSIKTPGGFTTAGIQLLKNYPGDIVSYYAWELSPAKVLHILERTNAFKDYPPSKIEIVHMSSTEFQSSRVSLKDRYDLIYIGGDNSGLKSVDYFRANPSGIDKPGRASNMGAKNATYYNMYFHNGDLYEFYDVIAEGYEPNGFGILYGNDLTYDKLEELKSYVNAGMPVVISDAVVGAFKPVYENKGTGNEYKQHLMDPDCNMYKFLEAYYDPAKSGHGTGTKDNILYGFNPMETVRILNETNSGEKYSENAISGVTVFASKTGFRDINGTMYNASSTVNEDDVVNLINASNVRPKFVLKPKQQQYDGSTLQSKRDTTLTSRTLNFAWDFITADDNVEMLLYIDDNVDSKYTEDEIFQRVDATAGKMSYTLKDDFSGAVNCQIKAVDKTTKAESSIKYIMYKISPEGDKELIDILQILPDSMYTNVGTTTDITLYFCTECQTSGNPFKGNHYAEHSKYQMDTLRAKQGIDGYSDTIMPSNSGLTASTVYAGIQTRDANAATKVTTGANGDKTYKYEGNLLGVHVHDFGIFDYDRNDTSLEQHGMDDLTHNLADEIEDDYDFNLNIMSTREFEQTIADVETMYATTSGTISDLRDRYSNQRSKYEAFYKEMKMLIEEDIIYVPSALYELRRQVSTVSGGGSGDVATVRANLTNFYTDAGIAAPTGIDSMTPDAILSDINTKLGLTDALYASFSDMLDRYELTITDHINFEQEMKLLGSSIANLRGYSRATQNMNGYIDKIIAAIDNGTDLSAGMRNANNYSHLRDELVYYKTHYNYYDFYSLSATETGKGPILSGDSAEYTKEYGKYYMPWRDAMIFEKYFYDKYMEAKIKSAVDDTGKSLLTTVFNIIILGPANHFSFDDLNDTATACIKRYADNDGKVLLYHDTIDTAKVGRAAGTEFSINIASDLRETFGMDARHLVKGAADSDKELLNHTFSIPSVDTARTFSLSSNQGANTIVYNVSSQPPTNTTSTYVYYSNGAPQKIDGYYAGANRTNVFDFNRNDLFVKLGNALGSDVDSATVSIYMNPNGVADTSKSTISNVTHGGGSTLTLNVKLYKETSWNSGNYAEITDGSGAGSLVYVTDDSAHSNFYQSNVISASYASTAKIAESSSVTINRGRNTFAYDSDTKDGSVTGFTTSSNKQKVYLVFRGTDAASLVGSKFDITDSATGQTYSGTVSNVVVNGTSEYACVYEVDNWRIKSGASISFVPKDGYSSDRYFLSKLANDGTNNIQFNSTKKPITTAITTRTVMSGGTGYHTDMMNRHMFKFGAYDVNAEDYFNTTQTRQDCLNEFKSSGKREVDDKVAMNNRGLLTSYPFSLPDGFIITTTHPQAFDLDVEDPNMTVYYSFVAGSNGTMSQMHAADPFDGTENYFIYQYNSITYCGAGHMNVTGFGTNNREERMLYINIIVNSLHKSAIGTQVKLYDENATNDKIDNGTANAIIKPDGTGNYTLEVKDSNVTPAFSVKAMIDGGEKITRVRAWYDLDLPSEQENHPFENPDTTGTPYDHKLFYDTDGGEYDIDGDGTADTVATATAAELNDFTQNPVNINNAAKFRVGDMKLKQEYFDAYDGMHTYIVVCVTTTKNGKTYNTYRKIRINLKPYMFDLT